MIPGESVNTYRYQTLSINAKDSNAHSSHSGCPKYLVVAPSNVRHAKCNLKKWELFSSITKLGLSRLFVINNLHPKTFYLCHKQYVILDMIGQQLIQDQQTLSEISLHFRLLNHIQP